MSLRLPGRANLCYPESVSSHDEEKHLLKVAILWAAVTLVLIGLAIGVLGFGLGLLMSGGTP